MRNATTSLLILAALAACGCKQTGFLAKRESEKCCPTDIRKTVPWCVGEDAIFQGPCAPSADFYGYKPTCWGIWPTSGAVWRDTHCGNLHHDAVITELTNQNPELIVLPELESLPATLEQPNFHPEKSIQIEALPDLEDSSEEAPTPEPKVEEPVEEPKVEELDQEPRVKDLPLPTLGLIQLPAIDVE